jgi:hypothetical protein
VAFGVLALALERIEVAGSSAKLTQMAELAFRAESSPTPHDTRTAAC